MESRSRVADLRAGDERRAVIEPGRRSRAACALRDVLVDLAIFVRARPKALDRRDDHARVERLDMLPGEPHPIERSWGKVLDQHVAVLHQRLENLLTLRVLRIDGDRAL